MSEDKRMIADRYEVGSLIGRGGMADVYEGMDTRLGRKVAIKLLKSDLANDPTFEARFRQEAQASARMAHPTIVRVYDAGEEISTDYNGTERKTPYIVMEYVRGTLLRDLMHQREISVPEAIGYAEGVLTALEFSHRAGVIHRDIKSANIMVTDTGLVKVMDFGIARAVSDSSATQAHTNGIVGTAQYFSPEQARGEVVDHRTDLYSTGVLLYEMLAGRPPFKGDTAVSVAYQHVSEAVTPPSVHNPRISRELDEVVLRALAKDRDARFQSAEDFREHLLAASIGVPEIPVDSSLAGIEFTNEPEAFDQQHDVDGLPVDAVVEQVPVHDLTPEAANVLNSLDEFEAIINGALSDIDVQTPDEEVLEEPVAEPVEAQWHVPERPVVEEPLPTQAMETHNWDAPLEEVPQVLDAEPDTDPFKTLGVSFEGLGGDEDATTTATKTKKMLQNPGLFWGFGSAAVVFIIVTLGFLLTASLPNINPTADNIAVADVRNQTFDQASATLKGQHLLVQKQYEVSDTVPADSVTRTEPTAGTEVGKNTLITVYVSSGKTQVQMPTLAGMDETTAKAALDAANLTLGTIVQAHSSTIAKGLVIETDPIAGTMLAQGGTVNLTISDGLVAVPDVRNYQITQAQSALQDTGLTVQIGTKDTCAGNPQGTTVLDQSILPGTTAQGGTIVLYVACQP